MTYILLGVLAAALVLFAVILTACGDTHQHTYSDKWTTDSENHWHKATCEHTTEVKDKAEHDEQGVPSKADIDSTYSKVGTDFKKCSVCEYEWSEVIPLKPKTQPTVTLLTTSKVYDAESVLLTVADYKVSEGVGSVGLKWYVKGEETPLATARLRVLSRPFSNAPLRK